MSVDQGLTEKQAKNKNETCSNLSLGIRLTRVKRLSRSDTTPDRCQKASCLTTLSCFAYHKMLRLFPKSKVGGISGLEAYHKK